MEKRKLGSTGLELSALGLGTVKFGRNEGVKYPQGFEIPDEAFLVEFLALAQSLGINTLDTAPSYGESEERLGRLLAGQREDWVIIGKAGEDFKDGESRYNFTPDHFESSLERSLKRLNTDYLDIFLIHSDGNDLNILNDTALMEKMIRFIDDGRVKALGASTKTVEGGLKALDLFDCVMATYNLEYQDEKPVLDKALELGKGVLIKKALASGHAASPAEFLHFTLSHPAVTSAIVGTINPEHLKENIKEASHGFA